MKNKAGLGFVYKIIAAGSVFILSSFTFLGVAFAAGTIYVKSTGCSPSGPGTLASPYCTIQQGVNAASPGYTVKVLSGTYTDSVDVNKSVNLVGQNATVTAAGADGVMLDANNISVTGFTFSGKTDGPAMYTNPAFSGYTVNKNTFTNNVFGLYLHSSGTTASTVNHNTFDSNNQDGAAGGNGIYSDQGAKNISIDHNTFKNQDNAAMLFTTTADAVVNDNLQVNHNTFNGPGIFFWIINGHNDSFDHNSGSGFNGASAVFLGGSVSNTTINHNSLDGNSKNGFSGIRIDTRSDFDNGSLTLTTNTNLSIDHNSISNFGDSGILVGNAAENGVSTGLSTLSNSTIDHNSSNNNGNGEVNYDAGIFIRSGNTGNSIDHNSMHGNSPVDARDGSTGSGTLNTGNNWNHNSCSTSVPAGLCSA